MVAFWRARINGTPPCSRARVLRKIEAHERAVKAIGPWLKRANKIAAEIRAMDVESGDLVLLGEPLPIGRNLLQCCNPFTETWEEDIDLSDPFQKPLKITQDYSGAPPAGRRKAGTAWQSFTLVFGRPPERLYVNREGHFAEIKDFRGKVLTFHLGNFMPWQPVE
jgi:hypothetical protein